MSSFKKIFSSQSFSQSTLQEPKVYFSTHKGETEEPKKKTTDITVTESEQCDKTTQSTQDSCYSWSGVSQPIDIKGEKRGWSGDEEEEEPWWESFKSQSTKKSTQETQSFQLSQPSSPQQAAASQSQQEDDNNDQENETEKINFYLKLGKHKKFEFM